MKSSILSTAIPSYFIMIGGMMKITAASFPSFTCNVLQYDGNGCNETDILTMELTVAQLFVTELDSVSTIYFTDYVGSKQDVFNVSPITGLVSYTCSSSLLSALAPCLPGGDRRLAKNVCKQPGYCQANERQCMMAGCPSSGRRRGLGAALEHRLLAGTFNITEIAEVGTKMINNMVTLNSKCKTKDLGFRCDLV